MRCPRLTRSGAMSGQLRRPSRSRASWCLARSDTPASRPSWACSSSGCSVTSSAWASCTARPRARGPTGVDSARCASACGATISAGFPLTPPVGRTVQMTNFDNAAAEGHFLLSSLAGSIPEAVAAERCVGVVSIRSGDSGSGTAGSWSSSSLSITLHGERLIFEYPPAPLNQPR